MVNNVIIKRGKIQYNFQILLCETLKNKTPSKSTNEEISIEWANRRITTTENQKLEKPYQNPFITLRVKELDFRMLLHSTSFSS